MIESLIRWAVHPHACGERGCRRPGLANRHGSSPRVWGTEPGHGHGAVDGRFIPTRVGNGDGTWPCRRLTTVHPHACGERGYCARYSRDGRGSSPRVWGTESKQRAKYDPKRFIPTRVGNGALVASQASWQTVHPHACGERKMRRVATHRLNGSSPRVWGTGSFRAPMISLKRFIPTRVGNGEGGNPRAALSAVHPHACGERAFRCFRAHLFRGSSPRVWGTVAAKY